MKTALFQRIAFGPFTILFLFALPPSVSAECPSPTVENAAGECTLIRNETLKRTLFLPSNTTLNCQGHSIVPGVGDVDPRKLPQVAIFLNEVRNVQIKNCTIEKFDFAIFAINSKIVPFSPPIQIFNNKIKARFAGISLMSVDDAEIRDNILTVNINGAKGIYVGRNSDRNRILNNEIGTSIPTQFDGTRVFRVPGRELPEPPSNPAVPTPSPSPPGTAVGTGAAILVTQTEGPEPSLLNAIIEGDSARLFCNADKCLFQLPVNFSAEPNEDFSEDNIVEGNTVRIHPGTLPIDGIALAVPQRTRVSNNTILSAKSSIRVGIQTGPPPNGVKKQFPGQCSNSARACLADNDCRINKIDLTTNGTCTLPPQKSVFWISHNTIIQNNFVAGPFEFGISTTGQGTIISGNTIKMPTDTPPGTLKTGAGIVLIGPFALNQAVGTDSPTIVTRNIVQDIEFALKFIQALPGQPLLFAKSFGAKIGLNDFAGNSSAVVISRAPPPTVDSAYALSDKSTSELSAILEEQPITRGNFWGRTCTMGGFDLSTVKNSDGSTQALLPQPRVKDSHPFGVPVAFIVGPEPAPCPLVAVRKTRDVPWREVSIQTRRDSGGSFWSASCRVLLPTGPADSTQHSVLSTQYFYPDQ